MIFAAVTLQGLAMVLFLLAHGTAMLFAARTTQGNATGAATGALSAGLIDFQLARGTRGALVASVAPPVGLALGAVGSGALGPGTGAVAARLLVVSYIAFAVPAVIAGLAATRWGLPDSAGGYAVAVVGLALAAATLTARQPAKPRAVALGVTRD